MKLRLGDTCEFINGGSWSEDEYSNEGIHVVKVTNIVDSTIIRKNDNFLPLSKSEQYKVHRLNKGDLIVATVGSHPTQPGSVVGRTAKVPPEFEGSYLNQNAVCIRVKNTELVEARFLYYLSQTILFKYHIQSRARGSANQVRMAIGELKRFEFDFPTLATQQKIASILSAYDDLIENNKRRIAILEKMAEEIYREWFVRMRFSSYAKATEDKPASSSKTKGLPSGWEVLRIGELFTTSSGGTPSRSVADNYGDEIPWVKTGELKSTIVLDTEEKISRVGLESSAAKIFPKGTVVIAMYCAMPDISILGLDAATNQACCAFKTKRPYLNTPYIYYLIKFAQPHMIAFAHGAAQQNLSQELIKRFSVLVADEGLVSRFGETVAPMFQNIETLMRSNRVLTKTRDLLLPRLISGKLSVENLDLPSTESASSISSAVPQAELAHA